MSTQELAYWLAASCLPQISANTFTKCLHFFSSITEFFQASYEEWHAKGLPQKIFTAREQVNWLEVETNLKWAEQPDRHIISLDQSEYPTLLKEIHDPPLILFVQGNPKILSEKQIAMVGARHATLAGLNNALWFAGQLVEQGWVVTSGLAKGIDAASHQGALSKKGFTIAVCAAGLNHVYPLTNQYLFHEILRSGGAVISEMNPRIKPHAKLFPKRNRLISGLSHGVLVVEAALKSGSLITARCALEQGRDVYAVPGSIHHPLSKGCHWLIRQGAKLVDSVSDITDEWSTLMTRPESKLTKDVITTKTLNALQLAVIEGIGYEITHLDVILLRSGLTLGELSSILLILELDGYIQSVPGGYIRTIS